MSLIDDIGSTVTRVVEQLLHRDPPPPPPALSSEQIQAQVNAATSDPDQRALLTQGYTQAQTQQDGALWQQTQDLQTLYHDREVLTLSR